MHTRAQTHTHECLPVPSAQVEHLRFASWRPFHAFTTLSNSENRLLDEREAERESQGLPVPVGRKSRFGARAALPKLFLVGLGFESRAHLSGPAETTHLRGILGGSSTPPSAPRPQG